MDINFFFFYGQMIETGGHGQNYWSNSRSKPSHSLSFPRTPSKITRHRPLESSRSEGSYIAKCSRPREAVGSQPEIPPLPTKRRAKVNAADVSSDESGDEIIVRIDSPSCLSFRQTSGN